MSIYAQSTDDALEELVINYLHTSTSFTSLDITNQLKEQGHHIRNRHVAEYLRGNVIVLAHTEGCLYNQTLITVDSKQAGNTFAYLYHHFATDADDYLDRDQNPKSFQPAKPPAGTPASSIAPFIAHRTNIKTTHAPAGAMFFSTREKAREYARHDSNYKFEDQGSDQAGIGQRWSCVPR